MYKGVLKDGTVVAVKRAKKVKKILSKPCRIFFAFHFVYLMCVEFKGFSRVGKSILDAPSLPESGQGYGWPFFLH